MNTRYALWVGLFILILAGGGWYAYSRNAAALAPAPASSYENASADDIVVSSASVSGGVLRIEGEARGYWYFEASFPVEVWDVSGATVASGHASAQGEWMTSEFVPFISDISIPASLSGEVLVVLKKDNPSGEPENDASLSYSAAI